MQEWWYLPISNLYLFLSDISMIKISFLSHMIIECCCLFSSSFTLITCTYLFSTSVSDLQNHSFRNYCFSSVELWIFHHYQWILSSCQALWNLDSLTQQSTSDFIGKLIFNLAHHHLFLSLNWLAKLNFCQKWFYCSSYCTYLLVGHRAVHLLSIYELLGK